MLIYNPAKLQQRVQVHLICPDYYLNHVAVCRKNESHSGYPRRSKATHYICGMEMTFVLEEIETVAREIMEMSNHKKVIAVHGSMGAGKTSFIKAICRVLEVKDSVSSPTFSIINEYESKTGRIYHMDLYRLKNSEELIQAGVEDSLYSGNLCLVEWPELAFSMLPNDSFHIYLEAIDESIRRIRIDDN